MVLEDANPVLVLATRETAGSVPAALVLDDPATVAALDGPAAGAGAVAVGHGAIWISAYNKKKVWRIPLPR